MLHRQRRVVHRVGEDRLRVERVDQVDARSSAGAVERLLEVSAQKKAMSAPPAPARRVKSVDARPSTGRCSSSPRRSRGG